METSTTPRFAPKTLLATFPSKSKPGHSHEVRVGADGVVYCTCPSWRFQKNHPSARVCKHSQAAMSRMTVGGVPANVSGSYSEPVAIRATRRSSKPAPSYWSRF
jgi:hypothetical protein